MSKHQIIYTSCMRGINGVNDGQQIYSYDAEFKDYNKDEVKSLFSYQPPALDPGVIMSEEIAATMPKAFLYRKLENNRFAFALNTYLGRDYMGSAGRFGNHLSHVIVLENEEPELYPCELFGSSSLRDHMEFEEVNNPDKPDYLPPATMEKGYIVDSDSVIEFLGCEGRLEIYKNMLYAMLAFESQRKRVVICDTRENIIMWIAALEYALPLKLALEINFSTYDFDPSLSSSQLCGVEPKGTRFSLDSARLHFTFDFINNSFPEFEKDEDFYEFIDTAMSFSYDSLQDFHSFLSDGYTIEHPDETIYSAYALYSLMSDGVMSIEDLDRFRKAFGFASDYANEQETKRIVRSLLDQRDDLLRMARENFNSVVEFFLTCHQMLDEQSTSEIKSLFVDRILIDFIREEGSEDSFISFYSSIEEASKQCGFSIATELMSEDNQQKLFAVMSRDINNWKISFIVHVVSTYVREQRLPLEALLIDNRIGQIYYGIVKAVYSRNSRNGDYLVSTILDEYSFDCDYLVNKALNLEGMLLDLQNSEVAVESMWKYFGRKMISSQKEHLNRAYVILSHYQRYDQIFMLYSMAMQGVSSVQEAKAVFEDHLKSVVSKSQEYGQKYIGQILQEYYDAILARPDESQKTVLSQLFNYITEKRINVSFIDKLINVLLKDVRYESPSSENSQVIRDAFRYVYNYQRRPLQGKLLLLIIGMVIDSTKTSNQLIDKIKQLDAITTTGKGDLAHISEKDLDDYFDWILPNVCELCDYSEDLKSIYNLFDMSVAADSSFFASCSKLYLKSSKGDKDNTRFCEFLKVVFECATAESREAVGKSLCKLSKQKLSDLNFDVIGVFSSDRRAIRMWNEIRDIAESTNPILNNLSNLFKRKKD